MEPLATRLSRSTASWVIMSALPDETPLAYRLCLVGAADPMAVSLPFDPAELPLFPHAASRRRRKADGSNGDARLRSGQRFLRHIKAMP